MSGVFLKLLYAMAGALGFALLFNVRGINAFWAALGGLIVWSVFLTAQHWGASEPIAAAVSTGVGYFYAQRMARATKSPTTVFLVPTLIPLIPGGALYHAMSSAVRGDWPASFERAIYTLTLAGAISLALTVGTSITLAIAHRKKRNAQPPGSI